LLCAPIQLISFRVLLAERAAARIARAGLEAALTRCPDPAGERVVASGALAAALRGIFQLARHAVYDDRMKATRSADTSIDLNGVN
jgi:hypothetical protein